MTRRDDIELFFLAVSAIGTFILVFLNLPSDAISLPSIPPLYQQIIGGVIASLIATLLAKSATTIYNKRADSSEPTPEDPPIDAEDASNIERRANATTDAQLDGLDSIEGCIEVEDSCWRGTAELADGELLDTEVEYRAICPNCQTVMYDGENNSIPVATTATTYWDCANCGHETIEDYGKYRDAQNLFERAIRRIVETEGEEYSLSNLIERIDGEATPRGVWEEYTEIENDDQISLNCFH